MCIYPLIQLPILRFLNRLDFMSLQEQDICLQRQLLTLCTFLFRFLLLLYNISVLRAHRD